MQMTHQYEGRYARRTEPEPVLFCGTTRISPTSTSCVKIDRAYPEPMLWNSFLHISPLLCFEVR